MTRPLPDERPDFDEIQAHLIELLDQAKAQSDQIAQRFTAPEQYGRFGLSEPLIPADTDVDVERLLTEHINEAKFKIKTAEDISDIIITATQIIESLRPPSDVEFKSEVENSSVPNSLHLETWQTQRFLEDLSDTCDTDHYTRIMNLFDNLQQQGLLNRTSGIGILYFTAHPRSAERYATTLTTDITQTIDQIYDLVESESVEINPLLDIYRRCGVYYEHALPPILAIINYLESSDVAFGKWQTINLANGLSRLRNFEPLAELGTPFNANLRNAVDHGGDSGVQPNPATETITFEYREGDVTATTTMEYREFKHHVIKSYSGAVSTFLFPICMILTNAFARVKQHTS